MSIAAQYVVSYLYGEFFVYMALACAPGALDVHTRNLGLTVRANDLSLLPEIFAQRETRRLWDMEYATGDGKRFFFQVLATDAEAWLHSTRLHLERKGPSAI